MTTPIREPHRVEAALSQQPHTFVDFMLARDAYEKSIENSEKRHFEVGVLLPSGASAFGRLGLQEEYGSHRVGSVTKTFTTFLALKLIKEGVLPRGLDTTCGDLFSQEILQAVFEDPDLAKQMTIEQLLSHTSGLEYDDHCYLPGEQLKSPYLKTLQDRFLWEGRREGGRKYVHVLQPGDGVGLYSNAGIAVACWMMEAAYQQRYGDVLSFSEIMKKELLEGVFGLTQSFIGPGPSGDTIQSGAGDMSSSVEDLMRVARRLQEGEASLESVFGSGWQAKMLQPRDLFQHYGIGCTANASVIKHAGLNGEIFEGEERDVTALVQFPLRPGDPGVVALCDSHALGPHDLGQQLIRSLEHLAGIVTESEQARPKYDLEFCPPFPYRFMGNAYLSTSVDPFVEDPPECIVCSRNGMKQELTREDSSDVTREDSSDVTRYRDKQGEPWIFIQKEDRKIIYSKYCLITSEVADEWPQPSVEEVRALQGVYRDVTNHNDPVFTFTEKGGHLYMQEGGDTNSYPCLYIPDERGGSWVVGHPAGLTIAIRFPEHCEEEPLEITDIFTKAQQRPLQNKRVSSSVL